MHFDFEVLPHYSILEYHKSIFEHSIHTPCIINPYTPHLSRCTSPLLYLYPSVISEDYS